MNNMSFSEWYAKFQELVNIWKEVSTDQNWVEAHKDELRYHKLNPAELSTSLQRDLDMLVQQILHFGEEEI